jgi:hypothetical protein
MRSIALGACAILLLGLVLPAMCADMPVYPKGKVDFELALTEKDFLPAIKQFIPTIPQMAQQALSAKGAQGDAARQAIAGVINDEFIKELTACIGGLKQVSVTSFVVPKGTSPAAVGDFYLLKLGLTKGWQRTLRAEQGGSFARLYTKPDLEAMLGIAMDGQRVVIVTTDGRIDFAGLTKLATKMVPLAMQIPQMMQPPSPDVQPAPPAETPAPGPPAETPAPDTTVQPQTPGN